MLLKHHRTVILVTQKTHLVYNCDYVNKCVEATSDSHIHNSPGKPVILMNHNLFICSLHDGFWNDMPAWLLWNG